MFSRRQDPDLISAYIVGKILRVFSFVMLDRRPALTKKIIKKCLELDRVRLRLMFVIVDGRV